MMSRKEVEDMKDCMIRLRPIFTKLEFFQTNNYFKYIKERYEKECPPSDYKNGTVDALKWVIEYIDKHHIEPK